MKIRFLLFCVLGLIINGNFKAKAQKKSRKKKSMKPAKVGQKGGVEVIPIPSKNMVEIRVDGKLFTAYRFPQDIKKPVLWPIINGESVAVTRGFPIEPQAGERNDHPHHVGLWLNHGDVNGHDFWNNSNAIGPEHKGPFGTILHKSIDDYNSSANEGNLLVTSYWIDSKGKPILEEKTLFTFKKEGKNRSIGRKTTLTALEDTVRFKDNKEGFLGFRVARFLEHPSQKPDIFLDAHGVPTQVPMLNNEGITGKYLNSSGIEGESVWGKRASWIFLKGEKENKKAGVAIFDHPENFNFPSHWHARGYGLFSINPLGSGVFSEGKEIKPLQILPREKVSFQHLILITAGEPPSHEALNLLFQNFSKSP
jgi:hypothetical protein